MRQECMGHINSVSGQNGIWYNQIRKIRTLTYTENDMNTTLSLNEIVNIVKPIADKYRIREIYLFGSYARNEATNESDFDFLVYGGDNFKLTSIFAFSEELRRAFMKDVDVFEIHELNQDSEFYKNVMKEKVLVA